MLFQNERLLPHRAHTPERSDRERKKRGKYTIFKAGARVGRPSTPSISSAAAVRTEDDKTKDERPTCPYTKKQDEMVTGPKSNQGLDETKQVITMRRLQETRREAEMRSDNVKKKKEARA